MKLTYLPTSTYLPIYPPRLTYLPTYLFTYSPTYLPTYFRLPYVPTFLNFKCFKNHKLCHLATWPNYKLVINCKIITWYSHVLYSQQMKNIANWNTYSIHCLCDDIIVTSSFAVNVLCNLSNATTSHFSCKSRLQLKISCKL